MRSASNRGQILAGLHGMTKMFMPVHKRLHWHACLGIHYGIGNICACML